MTSLCAKKMSSNSSSAVATAAIKDTRSTSQPSTTMAKAKRSVLNLQRRIFVAKQEGRFRTMRKLQNLLIKAHSNRLVSVRRVNQVDTGPSTPGVDNKVLLSPKEGMILAESLTKINLQKRKAVPVKQTHILKSNGKVSALHLSTLTKRALQYVVQNALEAEWEAVFEGSSYAFRPERSAQDALCSLHKVCHSQSSKHWIVSARIKNCLDKISYNHLLEQLHSFPCKKLVKSWLEDGYIHNNRRQHTHVGDDQGAGIRTLLANIAIHGIESALDIRRDSRGRVIGKRALIRYADHFIVACESKADALVVLECLKDWLKDRGLELSAEKTCIVHAEKGFDFLGFSVKLYPTPSGKKLLIKPSKESIKKIRFKLKQAWNKSLGKPASKVIESVNPIVRGWSSYYRYQVSSKVFSSLDSYMHKRACRFVKRTHPNKPFKWIKANYWGQFHFDRDDFWVFGSKSSGQYINKFAWTPIERHKMVKGSNSPFDPSLREYWSKRAQILNTAQSHSKAIPKQSRKN